MSKRKSKKTTEKETGVVEVEANSEVKIEESAVETEESSSPEVKDPTETATATEADISIETEETTPKEVTVETEAKPDTGEAEAPPLSLEEELELARQEAEKNLDKWQRAVAELANYKRRQEEQRKLQRDRIKSEVVEGVVSALDDMDLAFQNLPEELDGQLIGWVEGFRLVQRKLDKILDDQNVMPISTEGKFDPNFHEAVSYEENEEHKDGDIIAELRKGYQIGNRVIRPALVRVAK